MKTLFNSITSTTVFGYLNANMGEKGLCFFFLHFRLLYFWLFTFFGKTFLFFIALFSPLSVFYVIQLYC